MTLSNTVINRRYIIHNMLGQGGMGEVYRSTDRLSGQVVALKRVTGFADQIGELPSTENDFFLALSDEFRTLASIRHPNIISVLDYGFENKQPYFTMELLEAPRTILEFGQNLSLSEKIKLITEVLQALVYLHRRGILHRDLKPGNILVTQAGVVKVLDFGLSLESANSRSNIHHNAVGTIAYMAPELFADKPASVASDLYAVGVIACELLAGHHPFNNKNIALLINGILSSEADLKGLEDEMSPIVGRLLLKEPEDRYDDAGLVIRELCYAADQPLPVESSAIRESLLQTAKFSGRKDELQLLRTALDNISSPGVNGDATSRTWLVGGESGVGKSRLLDEIRIRALVKGALVLRGQAITEGSIPYQVWRDPIRRLVLSIDLDDNDAPVLKRLLPDIDQLLERPIPEPPDLDPQTSQSRFMRVVTDIFRALQQPTMLILEDLQWASDENLELLKRIIPLTHDVPLIIIASYRDDERPKLHEEISGTTLLKLKRLDEPSVADFSESILGQSGRDAKIVNWLYRETEGNVFFLVEVLRELAENAGELDLINKANLPATLMSSGIRSIIQNRMQQVPEDARSGLQLAALAGRELDLKLMGAFVTDLESWLARSAFSAVIEVEQDRWRFAHDKFREGLISTIQDDALAGMHRRLAETLEQVHPDDPSYVPAIARHYRQAGIHDKAVHFHILAGDYAKKGFANREAIAFYQAAIDELKHLDTEQSEEWRPVLLVLYENYGEVLTLGGQYEDGHNALSKALEYTRPSDVLQQAAIYRTIGESWEHRRQFAEAMKALIRAVEILDDNSMPTDPQWQESWIEVLVRRMRVSYWMNNIQGMRNDSERLRPVIAQYGAIPQRRLYAAMIALTDLRKNHFTVTKETIQEMEANLPESKDWGYSTSDTFAHFSVAFVYMWYGDLETAEKNMQESAAETAHIGDVTNHTRALAYLTLIRRKHEKVDETKEYAERTLQMALVGKMVEYTASAYGHQAWAALREGNLDKARSLAEQGFQLIKTVPIGSIIIWITLWPLMAVEIQMKETEEAIEHAKVLLGPTQQPLPDAVKAALEAAIEAWDAKDIDTVYLRLVEAHGAARPYGYV